MLLFSPLSWVLCLLRVPCGEEKTQPFSASPSASCESLLAPSPIRELSISGAFHWRCKAPPCIKLQVLAWSSQSYVPIRDRGRVIAEQGRAKRQNQSVSQENWDEGVGGVDIRRAHATVTCRGFHVPESLPLHFPTYCELVATITPWATAGARRVQIAYKLSCAQASSQHHG
jgi:hypothetical protein